MTEQRSRSSSRRPTHNKPNTATTTTTMTTTLEDLMKSPKVHARGVSRERDGRSLTPSRHRGEMFDNHFAAIGDLPLYDPDTSSTCTGATSKRGTGTSSGSTSGNGDINKNNNKPKRRSKSKDTAKAAAKEKVRRNSSKLSECGYGSDGVLDDVKQRHRVQRRKDRQREKDKDRDKDKGVQEVPVLTLTRHQSDPSLSPKTRSRSKSSGAMKRIASMFKAHPTTTNNSNVDSISTLNTEEASLASPVSSKRENSIRSLRSTSSTGSRGTKKRSSSSGPLLRGGRKLVSSSSSVSVSSRQSDIDIPIHSVGAAAAATTTTSTKKTSRGRSKDRLTTSKFSGHDNDNDPMQDLRDENERLLMQIERERQRSKRLSKKLKELKAQSTSSGDDEDEDDNNNNDNDNKNYKDHFNRTTRGEMVNVSNVQQDNFKQELRQKDNRIAELEQLVSSLHRNSSQRGLDVDSSNHDSLASVGSHRSRGSDAIWNRLQSQLNDTREELARTEELLRAQTANVLLQTNRVEELEQELKTNGIDSIRSLKEKCTLLQAEKKELETKLQTERRDFEDRLQKKDEALIYFRNELQKLKQTNVDTQRTLAHASSQQSFLEGASAHSSQSSTVQRAFGGISHLVSPALWSKDKVTLDKNALDGPKLDF